MRAVRNRDTVSEELKLAIGLVWGHLGSRQYEDARQLANGCLAVWPGDVRLTLMAAYASVEMNHPLDDNILSVLNQRDCKEWTELVYRRAAAEPVLAGAANA